MLISEEWTKTILVTIPKEGYLMECSNYRTIALLNHMSKVLMKVLQERLKAQTDVYITDEQAGFRKDRNTIQQILILRLMAEKAYHKGKKIYHCFIDFQKAFDTIRHDVIMGNAEVLWSEKKTDSADEEHSGKCSSSSESR